MITICNQLLNRWRLRRSVTRSPERDLESHFASDMSMGTRNSIKEDAYIVAGAQFEGKNSLAKGAKPGKVASEWVASHSNFKRWPDSLG